MGAGLAGVVLVPRSQLWQGLIGEDRPVIISLECQPVNGLD